MNLGMLPVLPLCSLVCVLLVRMVVYWLDSFLYHNGYLLIYQVSAGFRMQRSLATESMKKGKKDITLADSAFLPL